MFIIKWFALQAKFLKNSFKEKRRRFLFRNSLRLGIFIFGLILLYLFLIHMFEFAFKRGMPAFDFAAILLSLSLLVFLPLLIYSAIICGLSFLFQKEEIAFFLSLPVRRMQIFWVKFWQTFQASSWMAFCGILTLIIAIQSYFDVSALIYLSSIIGIVSYLIIPVCLGVILILLLSSFFPFVAAKDLLAVVGLLIGSLLCLAIRLMRPERLVTPEGKMQLLGFLENLRSPWMRLFPNEWLSNVCVSHYQGDIAGVFLNLFALIFTAALLLILVWILARLFYVRIWQESIIAPSVGSAKFGWQVLLGFFPAHLKMLAKKDMLTFYRNTVERGSLLVFIPMGILYLYSIYVLVCQMKSYGESPFSFLFLYLFNLFYASIVICGLAGRWVFPSISAEGENFKLIRLASISLRDFIQEKFWMGFLPLLVFGQILVIGSCLLMEISLPLMLIASFIMLILTLGITFIALILGARMADFSIKEPLDFALSYQGLVFLIAGLSYSLGIILLTALALAKYLSSGFSLSTQFSFAGVLLAIGLLFYFSLFLPLKRALTSLSLCDI